MTLPPITPAHRQAAFERLAMRGWTLAAAMADPLRRRVIEALAAQIRTAEWRERHQRATRVVRRVDPATGRWASQRVAGDYITDQLAITAAPQEPTP